ncbi:PAS domain-containing protein (plasmid) [Paraburkholderia sp. PREW-6R]|uniref:PAS domain-containing sensor histidine kinase n=1 Tax=Paraburkholderia sp. PREW-6R TaxID=3141544 RepID=UPI0031F50425
MAFAKGPMPCPDTATRCLSASSENPLGQPVAQLAKLLGAAVVTPPRDVAQVVDALSRSLINAFGLSYVYVTVKDSSHVTRFESLSQFDSSGDGNPATGSDQLATELATLEQQSCNVQQEESGADLYKLCFSIDEGVGVFIAGRNRSTFPTPLELFALKATAHTVAASLRMLRVSSNPPAGMRKDSKATGAEVSRFHNVELLFHAHSIVGVSAGAHDLLHDELRLREMLDSVPMMVWRSLPDGKCDFMNRAYVDYVGAEQQQRESYGWEDAIHPSDVTQRMAKWRKAIQTGQSAEAEVRIRREDGVYRWFLLRVEPFRNSTGKVVRWYGAGTDIEERKRAEENSYDSHKQLSLIVNSIPMLVWSALPDGHAEFFNDRWYQYTALSPSQTDGWGWLTAVHQDDFRRAAQHWRTAISTDGNDEHEFELRFRRHDGEFRWYWLRANAMRFNTGVLKRWYVTCTDIHDRKFAEESVRRSEALLTEAQRLAGLSIVSWQSGSDTLSWRGDLCEMFGLAPHEPVTRSMIEGRIHPDEQSFASENACLLRECSERGRDPIRILLPDGAVRYLRYHAYTRPTTAGDIEFIATFQDVTEQHSASEALARAQADLSRASSASSLGVLTASIAHEVNQPLAGIVTNANTCLRMLNSDPPNVTGAIETARRTIRDANRAADVISRLRKLFSHKEINATWWDLEAAVREVVELTQTDFRSFGISLIENYDQLLPPVLGDRIQLQQVVMNLLRNAMDAIDAASGSPRSVEIWVTGAPGCVHLKVKDSGVGIDSNLADKVFEPFVTSKQNGMGIGLCVSRAIVEAHGGSLWAHNNDSCGATFGFSIPSVGKITDALG